MHQRFSLILEDVVVDYLLPVQLDTGLQRTVDDQPHEGSVGNQHLVVETDVVEEVSGSYSALEVGQDKGNVLHQLLLALEVVEAEQREVLVDRKENLTVDFWEGIVSDQFDVGHEGDVDAFCDIDGLEELIVPLLLVQVVVDHVFVEHRLLHEHQRFYVLEVDVLL